MATISDPALRSVFQPNEEASPRALVVAGACGNVGLGKLGQFARLLTPHGIPVVALDPSPAVHELPSKLRAAFGDQVIDHYLRAAEWELEEQNRVVTDWELARGYERA